jgi:hypothetical protein
VNHRDVTERARIALEHVARLRRHLERGEIDDEPLLSETVIKDLPLFESRLRSVGR